MNTQTAIPSKSSNPGLPQMPGKTLHTKVSTPSYLQTMPTAWPDDAGPPTAPPPSNPPAATDRAVWPVVQKHYPDKSEAQCREIIHSWLDIKLLYPEEYDDPVQRRKLPGLK